MKFDIRISARTLRELSEEDQRRIITEHSKAESHIIHVAPCPDRDMIHCWGNLPHDDVQWLLDLAHR